MSLHNVTPGAKAPDEFNVIIEIPMNADPIKYEVEKESGALFVDRFMTTAMHYPCNYGYVPQTLADDGDPVDVLVITPYALTPGVVVTCRPLGVLMMDGVRHIRWSDLTEAIPAFLTMITMPLAVSISDGIAFGLIAYAILKPATGRARELDWLAYVFAGLFALRGVGGFFH